MASTSDTCSYRALLRTDVDAVELLSTLLTTYTDCVGTEVVDRDVDEHTEADELIHEAGTLVAYFERSRPDAELEIRRDIERALEEIDSADWSLAECERYTDEGWREQWKEFFEPLRLSRRIGVGPPWHADAIPAPDGGVALVVDPGMAFGTGSHETTRLSAERIDATLDDYPDARLLDVGCGSGILSMVAASLGAQRVHGIDIDTDALEAARENLRRNDLQDDVTVSDEPLSEVDGSWDVVVANILAPVLLALQCALYERVAPGGRLLVSGIPRDRHDSFLEDFVRPGWIVEESNRRNDWLAFTLRRE